MTDRGQPPSNLSKRVRAFSAHDRNVTHTEGIIVAYCDGPTYTIETASGERVHWRADLCEVVATREFDPTGEPTTDEAKRPNQEERDG